MAKCQDVTNDSFTVTDMATCQDVTTGGCTYIRRGIAQGCDLIYLPVEDKH